MDSRESSFEHTKSVEKDEIDLLLSNWLTDAKILSIYFEAELWKDGKRQLPVELDAFEALTKNIVRLCYEVFREFDTTPLLIFFSRVHDCYLCMTPQGGSLPPLPYELAAAVVHRMLILLDSDSVRLQSATVVSVDRRTNTVNVAGDDAEYKVEPHFALILSLLVENKSAGIPFTTSDDLGEIPGCNGKNFSREIMRLKQAIPPLQDVLLANNKGFYLDQ